MGTTGAARNDPGKNAPETADGTDPGATLFNEGN